MKLRMSPGRRVPPNFFGFGFGLAGLCETLRITEFYGHAPAGPGDTVAVLSALTWLAVLLGYLRFGAEATLWGSRSYQTRRPDYQHSYAPRADPAYRMRVSGLTTRRAAPHARPSQP